ncbi:ubiquinol-cytochrome C chaperone-domain-containing protein [Pelagophyceae sp. CCMP2097]|nr:ubiquinol-cytochrome C chaperone-domain-containing protein [Pelagophyceae sp. CCMP2097]|mmetsp:Transcript_30243/g.101971  ORF Transcript_30243/g.101971 Transcript_30243/m.101971 type:complete len:230 (-) Transcript_30243:92-781(-)|eukprot:CAMPEP_0184085378 /NCGR_PEP_ID=MMETSP0974-20121125/4677_1 /TAXON_ID=483370 /ORGANISM="non described non described, Strain CCMP2097" /LENGTH=229 /DNA_ID=CAMNT_0026388055 /DNA_START=48 /DNA_END=737 /DNA_ORIENTATION=+
MFAQRRVLGALRQRLPAAVQARQATNGFAGSDLENQLRPILKLMGYYGKDSTRARNASEIIRSCAEQSARPEFHTDGGVVQEFRPMHMVTFLHVWMVHRRLHAFNDEHRGEGRLMQELAFDELWEETSTRIRKTGIAEITLNKHLTDVQKYSFASAQQFDQALTFDEPAEVHDNLAAAMWRTVYLGDEKITSDKCEGLATYSLEQLAMLNTIDPKDIMVGKFQWKKPKF